MEIGSRRKVSKYLRKINSMVQQKQYSKISNYVSHLNTHYQAHKSRNTGFWTGYAKDQFGGDGSDEAEKDVKENLEKLAEALKVFEENNVKLEEKFKGVKENIEAQITETLNKVQTELDKEDE